MNNLVEIQAKARRIDAGDAILSRLSAGISLADETNRLRTLKRANEIMVHRWVRLAPGTVEEAKELGRGQI